ncbi:MAG: thioether cross-link-forming SCIFF peptide maturase [Patescibacteria group bacterium]
MNSASHRGSTRLLPQDQHLFTLFNHHFLLDVPTSSLVELDGEAYAALSGAAPISAEVANDLAELRERGLLLPDPLRSNPPAQAAPRELKALCLHAAHACDLRCAYCFAGKGTFGGEAAVMPPEAGKKAVDFLLDASGPVRQLEVDFFGGEPLLGMAAVRETVAYGRRRAAELGKRINFTLTTNAYALDEETLAYLNEQGISLVLSLDGRPEVHDRMRRAADGAGTYARAAANIARAVASRGGANYYVRGTFTRYNLDFAADARHILDLGFDRLSLEPVVARAEDYALRPGDLPRVEEEYEALAALYLERARSGRRFTFFHFEVDLDHGPCLGKRLSGCGAGCRYLAVTPRGRLYPCHQFVGREGYLMGDLERGVTRPDLAESFARADIYRKSGCLDCWARYFCGGGCHANADLRHGTILRPDENGCRLLRRRLECALGLKALMEA